MLSYDCAVADLVWKENPYIPKWFYDGAFPEFIVYNKEKISGEKAKELANKDEPNPYYITVSTAQFNGTFFKEDKHGDMRIKPVAQTVFPKHPEDDDFMDDDENYDLFKSIVVFLDNSLDVNNVIELYMNPDFDREAHRKEGLELRTWPVEGETFARIFLNREPEDGYIVSKDEI